MKRILTGFILFALWACPSAWASCEAEETAMNDAKKELTFASARVTRSDEFRRSRTPIFEPTLTRHDGEFEDTRSFHFDSIDSMSARLDRRKMWLTWKKAKVAYDACAQGVKGAGK